MHAHHCCANTGRVAQPHITMPMCVCVCGWCTRSNTNVWLSDPPKPSAAKPISTEPTSYGSLEILSENSCGAPTSATTHGRINKPPPPSPCCPGTHLDHHTKPEALRHVVVHAHAEVRTQRRHHTQTAHLPAARASRLRTLLLSVSNRRAHEHVWSKPGAQPCRSCDASVYNEERMLRPMFEFCPMHLQRQH